MTVQGRDFHQFPLIYAHQFFSFSEVNSQQFHSIQELLLLLNCPYLIQNDLIQTVVSFKTAMYSFEIQKQNSPFSCHVCFPHLPWHFTHAILPIQTVSYVLASRVLMHIHLFSLMNCFCIIHCGKTFTSAEIERSLDYIVILCQSVDPYRMFPLSDQIQTVDSFLKVVVLD